MADFSALKQSIQNYIKQNGNKEITGAILQNILLSMVTTMGDGAITELNGNLSDEVNRAKGAETTTLLFSDNKLVFKNAAGTVLYQISVDSFLSAITTRLNTGALYAGYATPSTTPATLTSQEVFYLATQAGTYTNFHFNGGDDPIVLTKDGIYFIVSGTDDDDWNAEPMLQLDDVPTASSNNAVKSGGVAEELALGAVYDVSAKNPTAGPNSDGKWESLSALLSDANLNTLIPTAYRKGGMSIKFVQSSDNKYIRYNLLAQSFTTDVEQWAIDNAGVYVDNPEFVEVHIDKYGKILWAIEKNGNIKFGAGVPQQVIDYIEEKIADLSLDEYEDIVAFLNDLEKGDKTLQTLLDEKVDKEEGKSLIDAEYAEGVYHIENPEWIYVILDSEKRIFAGLKSDGSVEWSIGVPTPVKTYIDNAIAKIKNGTEGTGLDGLNKIIAFLSEFSTSDTLKDLLDEKVDKEEGKSLIQNEVSEILSVEENPEYLEAKTDDERHLIEGITRDGRKQVFVPIETDSVKMKSENSIEWAWYCSDRAKNIVIGLRHDGAIVLNSNLLVEQVEVKKELLLSSFALQRLKKELDEKMPKPMVTLIDDDGFDRFYDYLLPVITTTKVPIAWAVIGNRVGTAGCMSWEQIEECYNSGAEILSHSYSHLDSKQVQTMTVNEIQYDYQKMYNVLLSHGILSNGLVFPGASSLVEKCVDASKLVYDYAFMAGYPEGINYKGEMDKYLIRRNMFEINTADSIKSLVDILVENKTGWLVLMMHMNNQGQEYANKVLEFINYCKSNNVDIVTTKVGIREYVTLFNN